MDCEFDKPCDGSEICDLNTNLCLPPNSETKKIIITIAGKKFLSDTETTPKLLRKIKASLQKNLDIKCTMGYDMINIIDYKDKSLISLLNETRDVISLIDMTKSPYNILCARKEELFEYWQGKDHSFFGVVMQIRPKKDDEKDDEYQEKIKQEIKEQKDEKYFTNFPLRADIFITQTDANIILRSRKNVFALVKTNLRFIDKNPARVGAYHNDYRLGDFIYKIIPIDILGVTRGLPKYNIENSNIEIQINDNPRYTEDRLSYSDVQSIFNNEKMRVEDIDMTWEGFNVQYLTTSLRLTSDGLLKKIPSSINKLQNLQKLTINDVDFNEIPLDIFRMRQLTYLDLSDNNISAVPKSLGYLTKLETLSLANNKIQYLPNTIGKLRKLEKLFLYDNRLQELPEKIKKCHELVMINVSDNQLTSLPEEFGKLKDLEKLFLNNNRIQILQTPEQKHGITRCKALRDLSIVNNKLTELPKEIGKLKHLVKLVLNSNKIKFLPESIGDLKHIELLDLSNNTVEELPESMGKLKKLKYLFLEENQLTSFPEVVYKLPLVELTIWKNPFYLNDAEKKYVKRLEPLDAVTDEENFEQDEKEEQENEEAFELYYNDGDNM